MTDAFKFLAAGAVSPFTGFRWPSAGSWVEARSDDPGSWVFACRARDLPYWLDAELWHVELDGPIREAPFQLSAPRARLTGRVESWNDQLRRRYARACALRARELALPSLPPGLRAKVASSDDPDEIARVARPAAGASAAAGYLADAAATAGNESPAATSYITCVIAASCGHGQAAFEAEREWQARWLWQELGLR